MVFPDEEGPNSLERSTLIVSRVPSTVLSSNRYDIGPLII
jgi:hypothetical protein